VCVYTGYRATDVFATAVSLKANILRQSPRWTAFQLVACREQTWPCLVEGLHVSWLPQNTFGGNREIPRRRRYDNAVSSSCCELGWLSLVVACWLQISCSSNSTFNGQAPGQYSTSMIIFIHYETWWQLQKCIIYNTKK